MCPQALEVQMYRGWAEQVWSGTGDAIEAGIKPLHIITKGAPITLQAFKNSCALVCALLSCLSHISFHPRSLVLRAMHSNH